MIVKTKHFSFDVKKSVLSFDQFSSLENFSINYYELFTRLKQQNIKANKKQINWLSLIPTLKCDGDCPYCYNRAYRQNSKFITVEDLEKYFDKLVDYNFSNCRFIRTYGGEPLLHNDLVAIYSYLFSKCPKVENVYISSGLLFSDKKFNTALNQLKKLVSNFKDKTFSLGVSLDLGIPDDKFTRISKKANIFYRNKLVERCLQLKSEIPKLQLIFPTIISKDFDLELFKENIYELQTKFKDIKIRLEIANDDIYYPSKKQLVSIYRFLKNYMKEHSDKLYIYANTDILNIPKVIKINNNNYWFLFPYSFCGIFDKMISFTPSDIVPCHTIPSWKSYTYTTNKMKQYLFHNSQCSQCSFYSVCRGLCLTRAVVISPKTQEIYCLWSKLSFISSLHKISHDYKDSLRDYLEKIKTKELYK